MSAKSEEAMIKTIRERFSEVFLASPYASRDDRKQALLQLMDPERSYTVEELRDDYMRRYKTPISRVSINTYVNELEAEGQVVFKREGLGGTKVVHLKT